MLFVEFVVRFVCPSVGVVLSTVQGNGDEAEVHSVPIEEPDDSLSPTTSDSSDESDTELLSTCQFLNPFPDGLDEDVPEWFKRFYNAYQTNETRKYVLMQETVLRMIDFEIRKCELLTDIIQRLKD